MVRQECSAHYSEISIDGQRILSVRFVPNTIKFAFASAKAFLNYELRITNYEFGCRPINCNLQLSYQLHFIISQNSLLCVTQREIFFKYFVNNPQHILALTELELDGGVLLDRLVALNYLIIN